MPKKKLQRIAPEWHAKVAADINESWDKVLQADLTAKQLKAWLGMKLIFVREMGKRDGSIPHGKFRTWIKKNLPDKKLRTLTRYMGEGASVIERMKLRLGHVPQTAPHRLLELPDKELNAEEKKQKALMMDLIEENGKFSAVTRYIQIDDDVEGNGGQGKPGREKGCKGTSREQREAARSRKEQWDSEEATDDTKELTRVIRERCDGACVGKADDETQKEWFDAMVVAAEYARELGTAKGWMKGPKK